MYILEEDNEPKTLQELSSQLLTYEMMNRIHITACNNLTLGILGTEDTWHLIQLLADIKNELKRIEEL